MFVFEEVLDRPSFLFLLDLEIKKAQRYPNYLSLLSLTFGHLDSSPGENPSISFKTLAHLLKGKLRDIDIMGQGAGNQLLIMLPYTDIAAAHKVRGRLEKFLQDYGFGRKGFMIEIDEVCFPTNTTNADEVLRIAGNYVRNSALGSGL